MDGLVLKNAKQYKNAMVKRLATQTSKSDKLMSNFKFELNIGWLSETDGLNNGLFVLLF